MHISHSVSETQQTTSYDILEKYAMYHAFRKTQFDEWEGKKKRTHSVFLLFLCRLRKYTNASNCSATSDGIEVSNFQSIGKARTKKKR